MLSVRNITGCLCDLSSNIFYIYILFASEELPQKLYYIKYGTKSKNSTLVSTFENQIKDESVGIPNKVY